MKPNRCFFLSILLGAAVSATTWIPAMAEEQNTATVAYENLSELLQAGNIDLKQANRTYETNKENYQSMVESLREEQEYMRFLANKYEDDPEAKATYSSNASILGDTASRITKQLERLNRKTQTISVEKTIDSYTMAAQSRMNSYSQMALQVAAKEKSVQAAEASYQATVKKQTSGAATATDVLTAATRLEQEKNLLASYRQQADDLQFRLLSMLGLPDDGTVTIGSMPDPDLDAINRIDYESDKQAAVNNNSGVKNVRHSNARTATEIKQKSSEEAEAAGTAEADFYSTWQQVLSSKLSYQAALDSYQSACLAYQSLQRRKQAGMVSQADYLEGEADYLQAVADMGAASMNLLQAYEAYCWEIKGLT